MIFFAILIASWITLITVIAWRLAEIKLGKVNNQVTNNPYPVNIANLESWQKFYAEWKKKVLPILSSKIIKVLLLVKFVSRKITRIIERKIHRQIQKLGTVHKNVPNLDHNQNNAVS